MFTSQPHFADHVAPIWKALDLSERGRWFVPTRAMGRYLADEHGIDSTIGRSMPTLSTTRIAGHQPHVVVASSEDGRQCGDHRRLVLVEHGAGQTYGGVPGVEAASSHGYAGGNGRQRVDLFLVPNETVAARNRARYPNAAHAVVGCPKLDALDGLEPGAEIAVTFHWDCHLTEETRSAWPYYRRWFEAVPRFPHQLIGHAHPRIAPTLSRWWPKVGAPYVPTLSATLRRAGVLVADNSSALFEAAAVGLPVVLLNAPWYRRDVEHGLRFWEFADIGPQVDHPAELPDAIADALHPRWRLRRGAMTEAVYGRPPDGAAAATSVEAMRLHLP